MLKQTSVRKMLVDGSQWASWCGFHIPVSDQFFVVWTPTGSSMHWRPGTWTSQRHSLAYFFPDAWFTLHIGYDVHSGKFISGYCDVVLPTADYTNTAGEMIYTDLYIDVVIGADYSVSTKDHEVFDRAAQAYPIVEDARERAFATLDELEQQARSWTGPFAIIPRQLPNTHFEHLTPEEAAVLLRPDPEQLRMAFPDSEIDSRKKCR
jgi:protein associated with RNAse G/E